MSESKSVRLAPPPRQAWRPVLAGLESEAPGWLADQRREAWERAGQLGLPGPQEELWRHSQIEWLDADTYQVASPALPAAAVPWELKLAGRFQSGVRGPGQAWLSEEARRAGVVLTDLESAARDHQPLVREWLGRLLGSSDGLLARNLALHQGGAFLRVPRGVQLQEPIGLFSWLGESGVARYLRHLIVVEEGARVVIDELSGSSPLQQPALSDEVVELQVGDGAWVGWLQWHELAGAGRQLVQRRAALGREARLESLAVSLGGQYSRSLLQVTLGGPGARAELLGASFPVASQRLEQWTVQEHLAPHATSDLLYRGALSGQARSLYHGTIRVLPGARRTDAYQANRNLVLSSGARADSHPQLEIANNDVRCTHGATVGPLDQGQLFYLMSRGLPRRQAERLLITGFFADVLQRARWSGVTEPLEAALRRRAELDGDDS